MVVLETLMFVYMSSVRTNSIHAMCVRFVPKRTLYMTLVYGETGNTIV
jgi:hypothetical protein